MRITTLILGIVLSIVSGIQASAVYTLSSVSDSLEDKADPSSTTSAGAFGMFAALLMFIAAAFVYAKPKVARVVFGVAALFFAFAGAAGFSDAWIWGVVAAVLSTFSHFGINEAAKKREREREELRADLVASLKQGE